MDEAQAARAAARHDQRTVVVALAVADPAQENRAHTHVDLLTQKERLRLKKVAPDGPLVPVESHSS